MQKINEVYTKTKRTERVIQFGEGGFLRGFADWMIQKMNDAGCFDGSAVVVQPIEKGMCDKLMEQDCLYTHVMRGLENGKPVVRTEVIESISRCVNPYTDFDAYLALARQPEMRVIISNTTEAGIAYSAEDTLDDCPQRSYPGKLTRLLWERYKNGLDGFLLLPCELIDNNGSTLREIVLRLAKEWKLEEGFIRWIEEKNTFCNTLVDRIVTGYPRNENLDLPYEDQMLNTSELFHLWVIEGAGDRAAEFPLTDAGLNVIWTDRMEPYRTRKVRILNGAHTSLVPYAMLRGFETVKQCMDDEQMLAFVKQCIFDEIIPTLELPKEELTQYAADVLERFSNPYIKHFLSSIALHSVSKYVVRVLPSLLGYRERFEKTPEGLVTALASLLALYRTELVNDDEDIVEKLDTDDTAKILSDTELWSMDLSFLYEEDPQVFEREAELR